MDYHKLNDIIILKPVLRYVLSMNRKKEIVQICKLLNVKYSGKKQCLIDNCINSPRNITLLEFSQICGYYLQIHCSENNNWLAYGDTCIKWESGGKTCSKHCLCDHMDIDVY